MLAVKPDGSTVTVTDDVFVPVAGVHDNQDALSVIDQFRVLPPELDIIIS